MYDIWYFGGVMGRGAYLAVCLTAANAKWEFHPVTFEMWSSKREVIGHNKYDDYNFICKEKAPKGFLPVMRVNRGEMESETMDIARKIC